MESTTGLTKDAGWQLGVRRTVDAPLDVAWRALLATVGVTGREKGERFVTTDGVHGEIRSYHDAELVRMTWGSSTLQLRVIPAATGTTVSVHQDHLDSAEERGRLLAQWTGMLDDLRSTLKT